MSEMAITILSTIHLKSTSLPLANSKWPRVETTRYDKLECEVKFPRLVTYACTILIKNLYEHNNVTPYNIGSGIYPTIHPLLYIRLLNNPQPCVTLSTTT